jgi:hypothetical protein
MRNIVLAALAAAAVAFTPPPLNKVYGIEPITNDQLGVRHCNYVVQATPIEVGSQDFQFKLVPALNGE